MSFVKWTFIIAGGLYLAVAALMYIAQRSLMYFPESVRTSPAAAMPGRSKQNARAANPGGAAAAAC